MSKHFIYSRETSGYGTWALPATWLRVEEANIQSQRAYLKLPVTGFSRDLVMAVPGAKPVNGPIKVPWWCVGIGALLYTILRNIVTTTPTTGVYDHALLFDDTLALGSISAQQQQSAAIATNVLSAVVSALTINLKAEAAAALAFNFEAKDDAPASGTWDYDGSASPAIITPAAYPATLVRPLMFYDATIGVGGTPSITGNKISLAGGTTVKRLKACDIEINNGVDAAGFRLMADPTRDEVPPGNRAIGVSFEQSWTTRDLTFYNAWRAGTHMALDVALVGPIISSTYHYEAHIIIPELYFDPAQLPSLTGDEAPQSQQIRATALYNSTVGAAMGIWIRTSEATL